MRNKYSTVKRIYLVIVILIPIAILSAQDTLDIPDIETYMQIGSCSNADITPNGETIYFLTWLSGVTQLYRVGVDGGWPYQLTFFKDGIDFYLLSPDCSKAIVGASKKGSEQSQLYLVDTESGSSKKLTNVPGAKYGSPEWSPDGSRIVFRSNEENKRDFFIYEMNLNNLKTKLISDMPGYNYVGDWSEDGRYLLIGNFESNTNNNIFLYSFSEDSLRLLTPHEGNINYFYSQFTPDGKYIYLLTNLNHDRMRLACMNTETGRIEFIIKKTYDWDIEEMYLSKHGSFIAWTENEEGYGKFKLYDLNKEEYLPVPSLDGIVSDISFSENRKLCFTYNSPTKTSDIWFWDWEIEEIKKVTHSTYAGVDTTKFVNPELIQYKSFDGLEIPAFLYLPERYKGGKIPFIIHAHGGPESQFRPGFLRHFQYLIRNGYGLLSPNIRGSSGYGKEYIKLDDYKKRLDSVKDIGFAAKWLFENGYTEPDKLAIKGGSYGGYMVLAALTTFPEMFACGIDDVGIANFATFLKNTSDYRRTLREAEYGPLSDEEFLLEISPITHVNNIEAPLLIIHGENDPRVPVSEARQIADAVLKKGGIVDTLIFRDEGHGVSKLSNRLTMYRRMVDFLDEHLKGKSSGD